MLTHLLGQESYALCITPGFFRFYSEIGILEALEEADCLRPSHVTGSSAGAMVGAMIAAGMKPKEVIERMLAVQRSDVWDVGGIGGLLKGELAQQIFQDILPVKTFEECPIPCAVTAFDLVRMRTKFLASGNLALAVRASITFPGLFQPVMIDGTPHIDGGVWDHVGMMALEHCLQIGNERKKKEHESKSEESFVEEDFTNKLVVNVVYSTPSGSSLPKALQKCRLLTIVVENIPMVTPFSMNTMGPLAYKKSRAAMRKALVSAHIQEHAPNHWICYVDGALVKDDELEISIPPLQLKLERQTSVMSEMTDMIDTTPRLSFPPTTPTIPTTSSTQTLLIEEIQSDENQSSHHGSVIALSDVSTPVVLKTDSTSTHHHTTTTIVEKDHFICQVPIEGDSSHMALVDHQLIHKTTTVTRDQETDQVNEEGEQKNILETMIEELYEKDNVIQIVDAHSQITDNLPLSSDTTSMEVEEGMSNNENVIESVLTTVKSSEKAEPQPEVLTHVPFAPTSSDSSSTLPTEDSQKTELKPETRQTRSTSFTSANLPDFIRIPSFSFINGTYYLYEKVSTTINSGMTTASETSNQLLNAVTTTIHTTFSSTTDDEEVVVGEKRSRGSDDTDVNEDNEEEGPDSLSEDKSPTKRVKGESD